MRVPSNYRAAVSEEYFLFLMQQQQQNKQQEDRDETSWNSLDGQKPFEAPPDCLQGAARAGTALDKGRQWYSGLHPL